MSTVNTQYHQSKTAIEQEREEIERAKNDPQAFSVLYDRYYVQIFRYLFKRLGDENNAADLTSQVFVKVLQNLHKYEFRGVPFTAWLHQIARNELNLVYREKKYDRTVEVKTEQLHEVLEEAEEETGEDRTQLLLAAIRELDYDEVELLEMRYFEKRRFKEVSEILNISESNAKVKMHRIIKKLKNLMLK